MELTEMRTARTERYPAKQPGSRADRGERSTPSGVHR